MIPLKKYNHTIKTLLFVLGCVFIFIIIKFYLGEKYPDWNSYKYIYENQKSFFRLNSYDFIFIWIMDVFNYFNIEYEYFRLILLILTSWILIRSIDHLCLTVIVFFTLINFILIFFQIRQGLAVALIYFSYRAINLNRKVLLSFISLFIHYGSILPVIFLRSKFFLSKILLFFILISFFFFKDLYFNFFHEYINTFYSHHIYNIASNQGVSDYHFITPILYIVIVKKIHQGGLLRKIINLILLFIVFYPYLLPVAIPPILFNSIYRILVIYLSFMILKGKLKPSPFLFIIVFVIFSKDLISSQIIYNL